MVLEDRRGSRISLFVISMPSRFRVVPNTANTNLPCESMCSSQLAVAQAEAKLRRRLSGSVGYAKAKELSEEVSLKRHSGGGWGKLRAIGKIGGYGSSPVKHHDPEVLEVQDFLSSVLEEHGVEHEDDEFFDSKI